MDEQTNYILPAQLRDELVRYLGTRPYQEVHQVIQFLLQLQVVKQDMNKEVDDE